MSSLTNSPDHSSQEDDENHRISFSESRHGFDMSLPKMINKIMSNGATTQSKGKDITRVPSPPLESDHEVVNDEDDTPKDKEIAKNMALILTFFKKIYKPTKNNLITSSNTTKKNIDNTLRRYGYERQTRRYKNQRVVNVVGNIDTIGNHVVQQTGIQCYNCKGFGHTTRKCKSAKRVKDSSYHKEKMLLCKQEEVCVQLSVEQEDWV
ncbi:hypothetical protein Tco_1170074 [Tanacetum coccineum]